MTPWEWGLVGLGAIVVLYGGLVGALALIGRGSEARAIARFVPDCVVLFRGLLSDPRVPRSRKLLLLALVAYLATPLDLIPDFIPVAGQLDDAILVALVLRRLLRGAGPELVREHWRGPEASLRALLRVAGQPASA
jgi:uncharacterized membrane protein YkvA (DUF1232 family)